MSHTIYQTEGIVFGKGDFGEADRILTIFTEKFGKISVIAKGVRNLESKLRHNIELFSYARFGLVAGREMWRLVDAEEIFSPKPLLSSTEKLLLFSKLTKLVNRMVQGEEKNLALWKEVKKLFLELGDAKLNDKPQVPNHFLENFEVSSALNILDSLGYIDKTELSTKQQKIFAINNAIKESML
jgi:DNA repair protein RecO